MTHKPENPFAKDARLRQRAEFEQVRRSGVNHGGRYCALQVLTPPPDGRHRTAIVVSRRYSKRAVDRNRARRLLRESYRRLHDAIEPCWLVMRPRYRMKHEKMQPVCRDLAAGLVRLGVLDVDAAAVAAQEALCES